MKTILRSPLAVALFSAELLLHVYGAPIDIGEISLIRDEIIHLRDHDNRFDIKLNPWIQIEDYFIYPFRQRGTCWSGMDGITSSTQMQLDTYCQVSGNGSTRCARCHMTHTIECYCVDMLKMDYTLSNFYCLNNCNALENCRGVTQNLLIFPAIPGYILSTLLRKNCVVSQLQKSANLLCEDNLIARVEDNWIKCYKLSQLSFKEDAWCLNECGEIISCPGKPKTMEVRRISLDKVEWDDYAKSCACNETISEANRYHYSGCQTLSTDGKPCSPWKSNKPFIFEPHIIPTLLRNYCRTLDSLYQLKCFDDKGFFVNCEPLRPPQLYIQPGSIFDIRIKPYIPGYTVKIKFQKAKTKCGFEPYRQVPINQSLEFQPYDVYTGNWSIANANKVVESFISDDGRTNLTVIKGLLALGNYSEDLIICACMYTAVYVPHQRSNACSLHSDYTIELARLSIGGPAIRSTPVVHDDILDVTIERKDSVSVKNYAMISEDIIKHGDVKPSGSRYLISLYSFMAADNLYRTQNTVLASPNRRKKEADSPYIIPRTTLNDGRFKSPLQVSRMGEYLLFDRELVRRGTNPPYWRQHTLLSRYSFIGYDKYASFTLTSLEISGAHYIVQSLFFRSWKATRKPLAVLLTKQIKDSRCSIPFGYSRTISPLMNSAVDEQETIWRASDFHVDSATWDALRGFNVCLFLHTGNAILIGNGSKSKYVEHDLRQLHPELSDPPNNISTYVMRDEWDFLNRQIEPFMQTEFKSHFAGREFVTSQSMLDALESLLSKHKVGQNDDPKLSEQRYPKAINFWSMKDSNSVKIFLNMPSRISPIYLGSFMVDHPLSFEIVVDYNTIYALVLSEGRKEVIQYNMRPQRANGLSFHLSKHQSTCMEGDSCVRFKAPYDMKIILFHLECQRNYLVIVTDPGSNCIVLLNANLREVHRLCYNSEGLLRGIVEPGKITCTAVYNRESCIARGDSRNDVTTASCFITHKYSGAILWVTVHLDMHKITIEDVYRGESHDNQSAANSKIVPASVVSLRNPTMVETVSYPLVDFVYLIQSESAEIHTFMVANKRTKPSFVYYGTTMFQNLPYSSFIYLKSIQMTERKPNTSVDNDYLILIRRSLSIGVNLTQSASVVMVNVKETIRVNDFDYKLPDWIIIGEELKYEPVFDGVSVKRNFFTTYDLNVFNESVDTNYGSIICVEKGGNPKNGYTLSGVPFEPIDWTAGKDEYNKIWVDPKEGTLHIHLKRIHQLTLRLRIFAVGPIDAKCVIKTVSVACANGYYYDSKSKEPGMCTICEKGTYNSLKMVKMDMNKFSECTKCPENESTLNKGASSESQCMCAPGYYLKEGTTPRCQPCPPGSWKSAVGLQGCIGEKCYKNSVSTVVGSTSEEGRKCACYPGYYYRRTLSRIGECAPCEEGYYCKGGFRGKRIPCPVNTTTIIKSDPASNSSVTRGLSLDDCICKAGYELADAAKLNDKGSQEHALMRQIISELEMYGIKNYDVTKMVCIPCELNKYKETKGNGKCVDCPENSFSLKGAADSISQCNKCAPGRFESGDSASPCEICPPNHICVGSDPTDPNTSSYKGKKIKCPKNAITIPPYEENIYMNSCLCERGYHNIGENGVTLCEPAPKNTYKDVIGNVGPTECPNGSYTLKAGATSPADCVCEKGLYFDDVNKSCAICPVGKYCLGGRNDTGDHVLPMECKDANAITTVAGASSESDCLCKQGYHQTPDSDGSCVPCPANTYKSYISNDPCTECDDHSSTRGKIGATSKEQCVCGPGYYFDRTCKACGYRDKYCPGGFVRKRDSSQSEDIYETHAPISCPVNTEIPPGVDTADSVESCKCGKGYAFVKKSDDTNEKICVPCSPGSYKSSVMDSSCNGLCTQNATSLPGAQNPSQCFCNRGYYYLAGGICAPCVEGAKCDGGLINMENGNLIKRDVVVSHNDHVKPVPIEGYYLDKISPELRKPDDWRFIKCPIKGACLGEEGCSESMTEYLCAECKRGYTNNFKKGALCNKCPNIGTNLLLTVAWYLGLLLVNIVMACLNVSAGFNRRSIHSVVIKIALNYGICMSVLNVINFSELALPEELKSISLRWFKIMYRESKEYHTSIDCLIQEWFGLKHADSFFYTMLFIACLPVILLVVVTVLMWVILELFKIKRHSITRSKLALLHQSRVQGMQYLSERLCNEYSNERLFLIFRYIPLPGETRWVRFKHFLEDMIPIYVTVLFSVHGNTTSQMLSLLDCTCITLGQSIQSKYVLRPAMSIKCSLDPSMGYIPYLLLGLGGLVFWGFGIPFFSYLVLLMNRKNLYAPDVRMKYGFLHNGYQQDYWFWEAIVFTRKSLVLVIGSIVIVPSQNVSGSRIWMALAVAVIFLVIQLIYKPFDERDYFVLGRLESHSMIAWTFTLVFFLLALEGEFASHNNMHLLMFATFLNALFLMEVILELALAYCDNVRSHRRNTKAGFMSRFNNMLAAIAEHRKSREPLIYFNQIERTVDLISPRSSPWYSNDVPSRRLTYSEMLYFVHIMGQVLNFANMHMKLDIIPMDFPEFISRLAFAVNFHENNKQKAMDIVRSLGVGNLGEIVNLTMLHNKELRLKSSHMQTFQGATEPDDEYEIVNSILLFDKEILSTGIPLSDFYMSLTIIKMNDPYVIIRTYNEFRLLRKSEEQEIIDEQVQKVKHVKGILKRIKDHNFRTKEEIFCSSEDVARAQKRVDELEEAIRKLQEDPLGALKDYNADGFGIRLRDLGFTPHPRY